jgi:hypothetical protein
MPPLKNLEVENHGELAKVFPSNFARGDHQRACPLKEKPILERKLSLGQIRFDIKGFYTLYKTIVITTLT